MFYNTLRVSCNVVVMVCIIKYMQFENIVSTVTFSIEAKDWTCTQEIFSKGTYISKLSTEHSLNVPVQLTTRNNSIYTKDTIW